MAWPGHDYVGAELLDVSASGVSLSVAASKVPTFPMGATVFLNLEIPGKESVSELPAYVRHAREAGSKRVLGLEIVDWRRLHDKLPPRLFGMFNRRHYFRVDMPRLPPIEATVRDETDRERLAHVVDLSAGGCGLLFELGDVPASGEVIRFQFCLPGTDRTCDLFGTVRSIHEYKDCAQCGIEFDAKQSQAFRAQQKFISQYVMERQRELIIGVDWASSKQSASGTD